MIRVDETDPVGEIEPSFPYRDVSIRRGVEFKDHYDIQSEIGRGKFGTVYRCKDKENGLSLAAKVVNTTRKEDRRSVEREVEIMRRLQHPRLIQLYDAIDTGRQIYVILELIEGGELFERVIDDDFVLTERSCAVFMRQICEGIEFIHAQNILHLDLKPENILCLTKEGNRIKIIDFGLARQFDPRKKLQVLFGTPEFVAPEVVNFDQIGFGTDMWSVGVICYVLLSGLSPFMGDTDVETMANVTIAKYDFDHEAFQDISEEAKDFIKCLLVKDKEKRATAKQCREHRWLFRKKSPVLAQKPIATTPSVPRPASRWNDVDRNELDVAKDNLRLFVERWREHPDSPYSIEIAPDNGILIRDHRNREPKTAPPIVDSSSLCGQSPSPCGSLCSSSDATNSPRENQSFFLRVPSFASYERRASEGTSENSRDPASQIVLAEEIIKLSEHLRSIAMSSKVADQAGSGELASDKSEKRAVSSGKFTANPQSEQNVSNEITQRLTSIAKQRQENGTTFNRNWHESKMSRRLESTRDMEIPNNKKTMDLTPPWRRSRAKHRFGETCRDVPRISSLRDFHKNLTLDEPTSTKNLLLHLLEEWEDVNSRSSDIGRKSISIDWCGEDSVARRSMNSLAEYFQAEQQHESAMNNSVSTTSVHR